MCGGCRFGLVGPPHIVGHSALCVGPYHNIMSCVCVCIHVYVFRGVCVYQQGNFVTSVCVCVRQGVMGSPHGAIAVAGWVLCVGLAVRWLVTADLWLAVLCAVPLRRYGVVPKHRAVC